MNYICFLTHRPVWETLEFAEKLSANSKYKVFVVVDDCEYKLPFYPNLTHILKIPREKVEKFGYRATVAYSQGSAYSRDKALYYFNEVNTNYDNIWLIEDDVLIPDQNTIPMLDQKYEDGNYDLISACHNINRTPQGKPLEQWNWKQYVDDFCPFSQPLASSMICAIRASRNLMKFTQVHAKTHNSLFMDEIFFNTICLNNKLKVCPAIEFCNIKFDTDVHPSDMENPFLFHPVKDPKKRKFLRKVFLNIKKKKLIEALSLKHNPK